MSKPDFLSKLQAEADLQAKLHHQRFLPTQLDFVTSFIGRHAWQVITVLAVVTSVGIEVVKWWEAK